jgi:hypothetical protein
VQALGKEIRETLFRQRDSVRPRDANSVKALRARFALERRLQVVRIQKSRSA